METFVEKITRALSHDPHKASKSAVSQGDGFKSQRSEFHHVAELAAHQVWWRLKQQLLDPLGDLFQLFLVCRILLRIRFGEFRQLLDGFLHVLPEEDVLAVWKRGEESRVFWIDVIAVTL